MNCTSTWRSHHPHLKTVHQHICDFTSILSLLLHVVSNLVPWLRGRESETECRCENNETKHKHLHVSAVSKAVRNQAEAVLCASFSLTVVDGHGFRCSLQHKVSDIFFNRSREHT